MTAYEAFKAEYPVKPYPLPCSTHPRTRESTRYWEMWTAANHEVDFEIFIDDMPGQFSLGDGYIGLVQNVRRILAG